ncbi:unnamed protein product [Linum tenue]|uniref:Kinesin motor domain-containing protein n=1 Tax=Linum tenue TaxID=586396 RepID=A0AAV0J7C3_9ROSI|nr:unnamed protein product [Linum tenue]
MEPAAENCSVKVALHVRPLVPDERAQGCRECVAVVPGKPQVQIGGSHSFTFDNVYGSGGSSPSAMYEECVAPLVDGLFQGYNATVLAYGQTGSGKTYTMGTGARDGSQSGLIPQVMNALFHKIETAKHQTEFQLHVSFIEVLNEEVRDLLDSVYVGKSMAINTGKVAVAGKRTIQIRESTSGVITLAGSTEVAVSSLEEMSACLEQGSLSRSTGSTNMNNQSSRSHAIFTITLEQMRKLHSDCPETPDEDMGEEFFSAKLHLVDLAGSERAKRTGSDGLRWKEGIHINKGLLALGNVISALGDEKRRKGSLHVPYRDSKLTRLLQDSLGGNSKTVMIACISPADINADETLNTLKYANRARNIQNKPIVNKDLISNEMQSMRQQLKLLQEELCARGGGPPSDEVQVLRDRISFLEASNEALSQELHVYRSRCANVQQWEIDDPECHPCGKLDGHKLSFQSMDSSDCQMDESISGERSTEIDEAATEWEHAIRTRCMSKELNGLNRLLERKESEMELFGGFDIEALEQHLNKKIAELEDEKKVMQIENLAAGLGEKSHKLLDVHEQKIKMLEAQTYLLCRIQILDFRSKPESYVEILKQKQKSDEAAIRLQTEIQYMKAEKVQLQQNIKQEAEQFRHWKASQQKELLQVLQRKTEEAALATQKLKELLSESLKPPAAVLNRHGSFGQGNEMQRLVDHKLEVMVKMHEVRCQHEKQGKVHAELAEELGLEKMNQLSPDVQSPGKADHRHPSSALMSPSEKLERIAFLGDLLTLSSNVLTAMSAQLSEAEEKEQASISCGHWSQLCSLAEAKNLLQYTFNAAVDARCRMWEREMEIKDIKDQLVELVKLLNESEAQKLILLKEQKMREQAVAIALAASSSTVCHSRSSSKQYNTEDISGPLFPTSLPTSKQLKFTPGIVNDSLIESTAFLNQTRKMVPLGQVSAKKLVAGSGQSGKMWRWKRSHHHESSVQFKWKWQKPWKLSEWIKHSDETIMRARPLHQTLLAGKMI